MCFSRVAVKITRICWWRIRGNCQKGVHQNIMFGGYLELVLESGFWPLVILSAL